MRWSGSSSAARGCWAGNYTHYQSLTQSATVPETGRELGLGAGETVDGGICTWFRDMKTYRQTTFKVGPRT